MNPLLGQAAFSMGLTIFVMALVVLPFIDRQSPEFVADVLALIFSGLFTLMIVWQVRRAAKIPIAASEIPDDDLETVGVDEA